MEKEFPTFQTVCRIDEIPEGEARMFVVSETMVGAFHVKGSFFALNNECPHAGASLAHGTIEGATVSCRIHHWRLLLRDGTYLDEDKPQCNARAFPVRVSGSEIQVAVPARDDYE